MLQYLVILLDDTSVSYCHYNNPKEEKKLISLDDLKAGILFAMKENLMIQFVYPDYELPESYKVLIETIDHTDIVPNSRMTIAGVVIFDDWADLDRVIWNPHVAYVLRTGKKRLFDDYSLIKRHLPEITRLNIVITDIETFTDAEFLLYKELLSDLSEEVKSAYEARKSPQINILTDRMMLDKMNNCEAGCGNITLAPDGLFYVCPAFYLDGESSSIGSPKDGLDIKNPQLYKLTHAPICRQCDAYQCKRCVYLNKKTTLEVNTPSHEQCVMAHLERNASKQLLDAIRKYGVFLPDKEIHEINYLDPFDQIKE